MFFCRTSIQYSKNPLFMISAFIWFRKTFLKVQEESAFSRITRFKIFIALNYVVFYCFWLLRNIVSLSNSLLFIAWPKNDSIF